MITVSIKLNELTFSYEKTIFKNVTLTLEQGVSYALIGQSGIGKSTLLSLIKGQLHPSSGEIIYEDTSKENISYVYQDLRLFPWQKVKNALEMPLIIEKVSKKERDILVEKCLEDFSLSSLKNKYPKELSGGQKQRVAMGRGLITQPDFLLLDEPTSSLDQGTKEKVQKLIMDKQQKSHLGLIAVTHDMEEAAILGEKILLVTEKNIAEITNPVFGLKESRKELNFYEFTIQLRKLVEGETK